MKASVNKRFSPDRLQYGAQMMGWREPDSHRQITCKACEAFVYTILEKGLPLILL